jgi:hypothetical protein
MLTAADVAAWMVREFAKSDWLTQEDAVDGIERKFGVAFVHSHRPRHEAINEDVLADFGKLTASTIVWDQSERAWRPRDACDNSSARSGE